MFATNALKGVERAHASESYDSLSRFSNCQGGSSDGEAEDVDDDDEQANSIKGLSAVVYFSFVGRKANGKDAADPVPVKHDMNEHGQGHQGERGKLNGGPVVVGESPKLPAARVGGRGKDEADYDCGVD